MHKKLAAIFSLVVLTISTFMPLVPVFAADANSTSGTETQTSAENANANHQVFLDLMQGKKNNAFSNKQEEGGLTPAEWQVLGRFMSNFFIPYQTYLTSKATTADGTTIKVDKDTLTQFNKFLKGATGMTDDDAKNAASKILSNMVDPDSYAQAGLTAEDKKTTQRLYVGGFDKDNQPVAFKKGDQVLNYYDFAGMMYQVNGNSYANRLPDNAVDGRISIYWKNGDKRVAVFDAAMNKNSPSTASQVAMLSIMTATDKKNSVMSSFYGDQDVGKVKTKDISTKTINKEYNKSMYGWKMYVDTFGNLISDNGTHRYVILPAAANPYTIQKIEYVDNDVEKTAGQINKDKSSAKSITPVSLLPGVSVPVNNIQMLTAHNAKNYTLKDNKVNQLAYNNMGAKQVADRYLITKMKDFFDKKGVKGEKSAYTLLQIKNKSGSKSKDSENFFYDTNDNKGDNGTTSDSKYAGAEVMLDQITAKHYLENYSSGTNVLIYSKGDNEVVVKTITDSQKDISEAAKYGRPTIIADATINKNNSKITKGWSAKNWKDMGADQDNPTIEGFALNTTDISGNLSTNGFLRLAAGNDADKSKWMHKLYPYMNNFTLTASQDVVVSPDLSKFNADSKTFSPEDGYGVSALDTIPYVGDLAVVTTDALKSELYKQDISVVNMYADDMAKEVIEKANNTEDKADNTMISSEYTDEAGKALSMSLFQTYFNEAFNKALESTDGYVPVTKLAENSASNMPPTGISGNSSSNSSSSGSSDASSGSSGASESSSSEDSSTTITTNILADSFKKLVKNLNTILPNNKVYAVAGDDMSGAGNTVLQNNEDKAKKDKGEVVNTERHPGGVAQNEQPKSQTPIKYTEPKKSGKAPDGARGGALGDSDGMVSTAGTIDLSDTKIGVPSGGITLSNVPSFNNKVKLDIKADESEEPKLSVKKANELMDLSFNFLNPVGSVNFIKTWFINKTNAIVLALHETITGANSSSYTTGTTKYQTYDGFVYQPTLGDNSFTNMLKKQFNKFAIFLIAAMLIAVIFYIIVGDITIQQGIIGFIIFAVLIGVPPKLTDGTITISNKVSTEIMKNKFDYFATFQLEDYMTHISNELNTGNADGVATTEITGANNAKVNTSDATQAGSGDDKVKTIIAQANQALGTPYVYGGTEPGVAFDCSGLTQWAYAQAGIAIPRTSDAQEATATKVDVANVQPGDLLFWPGHVALYIGDGTMIQAPQPGDVVKKTKLSDYPPKSAGHISALGDTNASNQNLAGTTATSEENKTDSNETIDDGIDKPSSQTAIDEGAYEKLLTDARNTENGSGVSLRWPQAKGENTNGALKTSVTKEMTLSDAGYKLMTGAAGKQNETENIKGNKGSLWVTRQLSDISASSRIIYGNVLSQGNNIKVDDPNTDIALMEQSTGSQIKNYLSTNDTQGNLRQREANGFINMPANGASDYGTHKRIYGPLTSAPVSKSTNFTSMSNVTPDTTLGVNSQYSNAMYSYFAQDGQTMFDSKVLSAGSKDTQTQAEQKAMSEEKDFSTASVAGTSIYNLFTESPYYYISWGMMDNGMKSDTQSTGGMKDLLLGSVDGKSDYFYNKTIKSSEPGYGELKDFTDMGSMFNVTIPYLRSLNKQATAFLNKYGHHEAYKGYGLLGPAYYKIDKNDPDYFKYWYNYNLTRLNNQYSTWVDFLDSSNLSKPEKISYTGKTYTVSNPLDPKTYTSTDENGKTLGRPMIFSESEMRYYGLKNGDLTTVERKIIEYNKNVHKELLPLMNYYTFHDATMTTIMAMTATFEFNKEFSQISVSDESLVQDPQGWSIGNFSYDAYTRLILSQATNEGLSYSKGSGSNNNEGTYEVEAGDDIDKQDDTTTTRQNDANGNIYERTLAKSGPLVGLLLVISDISAVWIIPALRLLINISVLALTVLILCTGILSIGANIYSLLSKAIIKPLIFTTLINVIYAFAISLLLSNGARDVTGELSPSLSMSPGQALLTTIVFEIALIYFLVKVLRKMVQDSINIGKVTANALRYVSSAATGVVAGAAAGTASKVAGGGSGNTISNDDLYGNNSTGRGSLFSSGDRGRAAAGANNKPAQNRFGGGNPTPDRPRPNSATIPKEMRPKSKSESLDKRIKQGLNKFEDEQTQRTSKNKHVEPTNHTTDTVDKDKEREKTARMRTQPAEKSFKSVFNPTQHSESKETKNPQANTKFAGVGRQSHNKQQEKKPAATSEDINKKINNGLKKK